MIKVIPYPNSIKELEGNFTLTNLATIENKKELDVAVQDLTKYFSETFNYNLGLVDSDATIRFSEDKTLEKEEYKLNILDCGINIIYNSSVGALYAVQTLKQIALSCNLQLPFVEIADKPKTKYRGFMFDSGRYFFNKANILRFIDFMVMHKLNVFHWHLTEDQGFRVEIEKYPLLTQKGSKRSHTNFGLIPHSGFYTKADIREIVNYCNNRGIIVIPEFDIPGHSQAAIACYPYLGCFDRKLPVATHWGVKHDILCAGKASTYQFVFDVIDELIELFPDKYFHIGGDEAPKTRWKLCEDCQAEITRLGLKDENQLQAHFSNKIAEYVKGKGYTPIMWNEFEFSNICNTDIIWEMWNSEEDVYEKVINECKNGRKLINGRSKPLYLDLTYNTNSLKDVYTFNSEIKNVESSNIIGTETSLWTEFVPNMKKAMFMTFPRIGAYCENVWSDKLNYNHFCERLEDYYTYLDSNNISYASYKRSNPSKIRGFIEQVWFSRRMLYWSGLHNVIDNAKVKTKYGKK